MGNRRIVFFCSFKLNAIASNELRFRRSCVERHVAGDGVRRGANACRRSTQRLKNAGDRKVQATAVASITTYVLQNNMRFSEGPVSVDPADWFLSLRGSFDAAGEVARNGFHDADLFRFGKARENRQVQNFFTRSNRFGERIFLNLQVFKALLLVHWYRVVDFAGNAVFSHVITKCVPLATGDSNCVLIPYMECVGVDGG